MHHVGQCRICKEGALGLRLCSQCESIAILCDECDSAWATTDLGAKPVYTANGKLPCPTCAASLWTPPSHWATQQEIAARAWLQTAIDAGKLKLSESEPYR
jgi:hypothetical protein